MNIGIWFLVTFELKIRAGRNLWSNTILPVGMVEPITAKINTTYEWTKNSNYVKPKSPPQLLRRRFWFNVV